MLRAMRGRPNLPNALDLEHVIEEIESVGSEVRSAVESVMRQILLHLIEAAAARPDGPVVHWRGEIARFHAEIDGRYSLSMRNAIDLDRLWRRAVMEARLRLEEHGDTLPRTIPDKCPVPFEAFVAEDFPLEDALARVLASLAADPE